MTQPRHIVVLGGGPAGLQAALSASGPGRSVSLISESPPGGRAVWQTLLPSKMWLSADKQSTPGDLRLAFEKAAGAWQKQLALQLELAGVNLRLGTASFLSPHDIQIVPPEGGYPDQITADAVIIATGAVPFVPPGLEPDGERIFSPHQILNLQSLPRDMVMIGAGGPAAEYVDAFSRLGTRITWITGPAGVLPTFPPEAGRAIDTIMQSRGVRIITGLLAREIVKSADGLQVVTTDGERHAAEMAFVAIGLRPDLDRLNLPAAGLKPGSTGGLATDQYGRTTVSHIYLVGDAAGPLSANISIAQGRQSAMHAAGLNVIPLRLDHAVMAIYTDPQVAMVGRMTDRVEPIKKARVPFSICLRAYLAPANEQVGQVDENCFLEIAYDSTRRITGALAVCPQAAEIATPLAVAIRAGMTVDELASVDPAHPTFSELAVLAARSVK